MEGRPTKDTMKQHLHFPADAWAWGTPSPTPYPRVIFDSRGVPAHLKSHLRFEPEATGIGVPRPEGTMGDKVIGAKQ